MRARRISVRPELVEGLFFLRKGTGLQKGLGFDRLSPNGVRVLTDLTDLTVADIRDGFRAGDFSAREVAEAFNANVTAAISTMGYGAVTPIPRREQVLAALRRG
mgnify:CR=1 FL=1